MRVRGHIFLILIIFFQSQEIEGSWSQLTSRIMKNTPFDLTKIVRHKIWCQAVIQRGESRLPQDDLETCCYHHRQCYRTYGSCNPDILTYVHSGSSCSGQYDKNKCPFNVCNCDTKFISCLNEQSTSSEFGSLLTTTGPPLSKQERFDKIMAQRKRNRNISGYHNEKFQKSYFGK